MADGAVNGLLLIDKPVGMRSTECVNMIRHAFRNSGTPCRVGHAGTLDSTASGLLVILLGAATKLSERVMSLPKEYRATLRLGRSTDTCDAAGATISEGSFDAVTDEDIRRIAFSFLGWRMQRPPEISAVKIKGRPAHKLARAGKEVKIEPRPVFVRSISCSPLRDGAFDVTVRCGRGTYIRSIARDMGEKLGCGAYVESLRRFSIGPFTVENAAHPADVANDTASARVLPPETVPLKG